MLFDFIHEVQNKYLKDEEREHSHIFLKDYFFLANKSYPEAEVS